MWQGFLNRLSRCSERLFAQGSEQGNHVSVRTSFPNGFDDSDGPLAFKNIQMSVDHSAHFDVEVPITIGQVRRRILLV
jgi:hypothetical protein